MTYQPFEVGGRYRHKNTLDTEIHVVSARPVPTGWKLRVKYWNVHYKTYQGEPENVTIKTADIKKWSKQ